MLFVIEVSTVYCEHDPIIMGIDTMHWEPFPYTLKSNAYELECFHYCILYQSQNAFTPSRTDTLGS